MAYDGVVISNIIYDIRRACQGGRLLKLQQPAGDTITLTMKGREGQTRIFISVNPGLPICYIAGSLPQAPMQAPAFCMLLRKHLVNGRLTDIKQPGFDRVFDFVFEHMDEMGDLTERHLIVEIMGRQSNIILADQDYMIIDCLRRVMPDLSDAVSEGDLSRVRILYPGQEYIYPDAQGKLNPVDEESPFDRYTYETKVVAKAVPIPRAIFTSITGFSKGFAEYIVDMAGIDGRKTFSDITVQEKDRLYDIITGVIDHIKEGSFSPKIIYSGDKPVDYISISDLDMAVEAKDSRSVSELLVDYYSSKERDIKLRSRSADIKKLLTTAIDRASRKYDLQLQQLRDTEDRDKYRIYGELLNTYGYELKGGENVLKCINYYDNTEIEIPLDSDLTAQENSQKYFAKYNKKKRTYEALTEYTRQTREELDYLLSARHSMEIAETEADIAELRDELRTAGIIKTGRDKKGSRRTDRSKPLHFVSSDGYDIYVGKNNIQNEELTFGLAKGRDIWFHAKQMPGSHVIVKLKQGDSGLEDVPDRVFEEAAGLAAYYSSGSDAPKVEVDYTERRNLKKPPQSRPGYVIYHQNYSMMAEPRLI